MGGEGGTNPFEALELSVPFVIRSNNNPQWHSLWLVNGKPLKLWINIFSGEIGAIQCNSPGGERNTSCLSRKQSSSEMLRGSSSHQPMHRCERFRGDEGELRAWQMQANKEVRHLQNVRGSIPQFFFWPPVPASVTLQGHAECESYPWSQ